MNSASCSDCGLAIGTERWVKIDGRLYHGRCWETMRSRSKLKNDLSLRDHLRCPECSLPIRQGDSTSFRGGYAIHLDCQPPDDSS